MKTDQTFGTIASRSCLNLCPATDGMSLQTVETPGTITRNAPSRPIYVHDCQWTGRILFFADNSLLSCIYADIDDQTVVELGRCNGDIIGIAPAAYDTLTVMTDSGPETVSIDTSRIITSADTSSVVCRLIGPVPNFPPFRFETRSEMTLTETVDPARLTGSYDLHSTSLSRSDTDRLTADLRDAYVRLCNNAYNARCHVQPRLARYRLYDHDGNTLFVSTPILLSGENGVAMTGTLSVPVDAAFAERKSFSISASVYNINLCRDQPFDSPWKDRVSCMMIEMTTPVHLLNPDIAATARLDRVSTDSLAVTCRMPGVSSSVSSRTEAVIAAMLDNDSLAFGCTIMIPAPFDGDTFDDVITPGQGTSSLYEIGRVSAMMDKAKRKARQKWLRQTVIARALACLDGKTSIMGNLTYRRLGEYAVGDITAQTVRGLEWRAALIVTSASGDVLDVVASSGDDFAPLQLSPLILSSLPDAAFVTVRVQRGDQCYSRKFTLARTPGGSYAYWLSPDMRPVAIDDPADDFIIPACRQYSVSNPGEIVTVRAGDPDHPVSSLSTGHRRVVAIVPVPRSVSGWSASRRRCYVFTDRDIRLVDVDSQDRLSLLGIVDTRGIADQRAVTVTADPRYPVIAIAGRSLVALRGNSVVNIIDDICETLCGVHPSKAVDIPCEIAFDPASGATIVADSGGNLKMIPDLADPLTFTDLSDFRADSMLPTGDGLILADGNTLRHTALPPDDNAPDIPVRVLYTFPERSVASAVEIPIYARSFNGKVSLLASGNPLDFIPEAGIFPDSTPLSDILPSEGIRRKVLELDINGSVETPIVAPVVAPLIPPTAQPMSPVIPAVSGQCRHLALLVSGHADRRSRLYPPRLRS